MKANEIYTKTMKFVWLKLGFGMAVTAVSLVLMAVIMGIASLFHASDALVWAGTIWLILTAAVYGLAMHYVGYMLKAAHVAVVATAVTTGVVPENMFEAGKQMVIERFGAVNAYFVLDRMISGAVSQLQKAVGKIDQIFGKIPGVSAIVSFLQIFIGIALGYIDECCMGYTFCKKGETAFKAGCDGVVIYFQNIKILLKSALVTSFIVVVLSFVAWLVPFAVFGLLFSALKLHLLFAVLLAVVVASVLKTAFIDSYIMVRTMAAYMQIAPHTVITYDIYDKLCKLSGKFKSLFKKAHEGVIVS
ncbi:MAG: hypothetical protein IJX63_11255 [Lachnospiraceae bacterium]|nr:hypothetical protein [Lachnospiraceae bacterium]